jgi:O-antigen/teichoic acid export membrane protein
VTRLRGARAFGAGIVDQVVIAAANAGNSLLALLLIHPNGRAGVLALALVVGYVVVSLNRAFVGEVLLALAARFREESAARVRLVRDGLTAASIFGLLAAALLALVWGIGAAVGGELSLPDLIWVAVVLPVILLHDTARYSYLAAGAPQKALVIDLTFVAVQGLAVLAVVLVGVTPARLLLCWGVGAAAGFGLFAVRTRHLPWRGDARRWLGQTRFLSGWFTATAVIGQLHVLAVNFLIGGALSRSAVSAFRFVQTTVLQPVQNLNQSLMSLFVPRVSHRAGAAEKDPAAAVALRREVLRGAAILGGLAVVLIAVGGPLTQLVLPYVRRYADAAPLAWPMLVQGGIYMVQAPFTAAMRGMHRARMQFAQYVVFSAVSLIGLVVGARGWGLVGAGWGLAIGSLIGLATTVAFYWYALRWLGHRDARVAALDV